MSIRTKLQDHILDLVKALTDPYTAISFIIFTVLMVLALSALLKSETIFGIPNIFVNAGITVQSTEIDVLGFKFDRFSLFVSSQFIAVFFLSKKDNKSINTLLLLLNVAIRLLSSLHLPVSLTDIFRNEVYGELAIRGYNPYSTHLSPDIPFVREYEAAGLPAYLWSAFTFTYPTFTGFYFLALCSIFPGYGYWQEVFILFTTSMLDVASALLLSRILNDKAYRYAVLLTFFPLTLEMALNGQIEPLPNFLIILSYYFVTKNETYKSFVTLALAFQAKLYPLMWIPTIINKSKKKARGVLCFALVAVLLFIPILLSPYYLDFFAQMPTIQPYPFQTRNLMFITSLIIMVVSAILLFNRRNLMYSMVVLSLGLLYVSFRPWYFLWLIPISFILVKDDKKVPTILLLYIFIFTLFQVG